MLINEIKDKYNKSWFKITESGINRILSHGEHGMIIISANRGSIDSGNPLTSLEDEFNQWCLVNQVDPNDASKREFWLKERNKQADLDLKADLKRSPFAYTPVYGGYHGTDDVVDSYEPSFIVYCHGKKYSADYEPFEKLYNFAIEMCKKYKQDSVYIQPPGEAPFYVDGNGNKVSKTSTRNVKVNDDNAEFFTTDKRKKGTEDNKPHKFTYDIQFENLYRTYNPSTYNDRMRRRQYGEIFVDENITN